MRAHLRALSIVLALGLGPVARAQTPVRGSEPGPVLLLGEQASVEGIPELSGELEPSLVLWIDESEGPPAPLDPAVVAGLGGGPFTRVVGLRREDWNTTRPDELIEAVRGARHVALGPGSIAAWLEALYPRHKADELLFALGEARRRGAVLVGRGERAVLLSAAGIVSGPEELRLRESNPRRLTGPRIFWSTAFQPWAVADTAARAEDSLDRLARLLVDDRLRLGLLLERGSALVFDARGGGLISRGSDPVWILDLRNARRREHALRDLRLSVLLDGDAWSRRDRRVTFAPGGRTSKPAGGSSELDIAEPLSVAGLRDGLERWTAAGTRAAAISGAGVRLAIESDADSAVQLGPDGRARGWAGLRVDVEWPADRGRD